MKTLILSAAILLLAATAWAEEAKTDSGRGSAAPVLRRLPSLDASKLNSTPSRLDSNAWTEEGVVEFSDEKNGVFVRVEQGKREGQPIRGNSQRVIVEQGVQWVEYAAGAGDRVRTVRLRCTPETWRYILQTPETPAIARFMATRDIYKINEFAKGERLALIELASRDGIEDVRRMAVIRAAEFVPRYDAVPILCRALCDPSGRVAAVAGRELASYFFPQPAPNGDIGASRFRDMVITGTSFEDCEERYQRACRRDALGDARRIHEAKPDLVTEEDLATIERLLYSPMVDSVKPGEDKPEAKVEAKPDAKPDAKPPQKPDAKSP
jgi:hypothetical protein